MISPKSAPRPHLRAALAGSGALVMLGGVLAGCSSSTHGDGAGGSTPSTPVASTSGESALTSVTVTRSEDPIALQSESALPREVSVSTISTQVPRVQIGWPRIRGAQALNISLGEIAAKQAHDFGEDAGGSQYAPPSLTTTWSMALTAPSMLGVRLATQEFAGASTGHRSVVVYGTTDGRSSWRGTDLVAQGARGRLVDEAVAAVRAAGLGSVDPAEDAVPEPDELLDDVTFLRSGQMRLTVPKSVLARADVGTVVVTFPAAQVPALLTPAGARVLAAATGAPAPAPDPAVTAPSTPAAPPADDTDCREVRCIALTFDDGPGPLTSGVLDTLAAKKARASFFVLGRNASVMPDVLARAMSLGMAIGNHTWTHRDLARLPQTAVLAELNKTSAVVRRATGAPPFAARPPYGSYTPATDHAGLPFVLWDVDTEDWKNRDVAQTTRRALDGARPGAIVLMHDIHPSTAAALPGIIDGLQARGYHLVTVPTLLGTMDPTGAYFHAPSH